MTIDVVKISCQEGCNLILGQAHFIKTVEDLAEILISAVPGIKFGLAFSEASGPCLIRSEGTDSELINQAVGFAQALGAGHSFCILLKDCFPINVLNQIKNCPEVCRIYCATGNPLEVILATTDQGRGILGVVDGFSPKGVEGPQEKSDRKELLRRFGYKF